MELGHFEHRWTSGRKSFILGRTGTIIFLDTFVATATKTGPTGCLSGFTENASTIHKLISITNRKHFISQWWKLSNDWVKTVQKFLSNKNRSLERNCKRIASDHNRLLSKAFSFFLQLYVRFGGILFLIIYDLKLKKCLRWYLRLLQLPPKGIFSSTNAELVGQCVF